MVDDMKVADIDYSYGFSNGSPTGDPHHENSDWTKIQDIACFTHNDPSVCEFIVYIVHEELYKHLSDDFKEECKQTREAGFKYACFWA